MPPTGFATSDPLPDAALRAAGPPRYPRPSRLATPLPVKPPKAAAAAERLGLLTVGDLLEHLPRDRQDARTVIELEPGESATVVVEVRSISSRSVRRRGMRPLVEAVVGDETGTMKATFFNQPWLERNYKPGTRLLLQGKYEARNRFRVQFHAPTAEAVGVAAGTEVATYPATEGLSSTQILALVREWRGAAQEALEPLPARLRARPAAGPPGGARRCALRRSREWTPPAGLRRAPAAADRPAAPPRPPPRGGAGAAARPAG